MKRLLVVVGLLLVAAIVFSLRPNSPFLWSGETPAGTASDFWWLNQD